MQKKEKDVHEKYTTQDLGSPEEQIERLVAPNYQWRNLNSYKVLILDVDATEEDIKGRYRKLSAMVHPDKRIGNDDARGAFEEVKKAYQTLMDKGKRQIVADNVIAVRKRIAKQRAKLVAKGMTTEQLLVKCGAENAHIENELMKEFAEMEMRRRDVDAHKQVQKNRERQDVDKEAAELKRIYEREKKWNEEKGREGRVGSWRTFAGGNQSNLVRKSALLPVCHYYYRYFGIHTSFVCFIHLWLMRTTTTTVKNQKKKAKKAKMWKEEEREDVVAVNLPPGVKDRKKKDNYKKNWK